MRPLRGTGDLCHVPTKANQATQYPTQIRMNDPTQPRLFHVSDRAGLARFEPRPPPSPDSGVTDSVVWAIEERLLANYLLPRDCPRVTFHSGPETSQADRTRFFDGAGGHVVVIEAAWLSRVRPARLWLYEFPPDTFTLADACAGYQVSRQAIVPISASEVGDLPAAIAARGVEFRIAGSLWPLRDAVFASTLRFSFIRMRHARPRTAARFPGARLAGGLNLSSTVGMATSQRPAPQRH